MDYLLAQNQDLTDRLAAAEAKVAALTADLKRKLPEEDEDRVAAFLATHPEFARTSATTDPELLQFLTPDGDLRLTPRTSGTDGFYVAVLQKSL